MTYILSKTDYLLYRECSKNLWCKIHKPDVYFEIELSEFEKAIIETGNEVEEVARKLFPKGILIEGRDKKTEKKTQELMSKKKVTLFQPLFVKDGFLAALDILEYDPKDKSCVVYEVKATNSIHKATHYYDLAFQVNLLKMMGYVVKSANIIHLNPEYIKKGEINKAELFKIEDITTEINNILQEVDLEMKVALKNMSSGSEEKGYCCCVYKGRSKHCATFKYSNSEIPEYSVHDIARIGSSKKKLEEMIDIGVLELKDIPDSIKLNDSQRNQIDTHVLDKKIIQKDEIRKELDNLTFPLYFLDYETYPSSIPRFDGFSPYQQIPFQYSLQILDSPGSELRHVDFLHRNDSDPSFNLATALREQIGESGSVIVWSKSFECKINRELGKRNKEFISLMDSVNERVYDLMDIFTKQYYVDKAFCGRTSIKSILPVIVPEFSYKDLDIQEGGTASQRWNILTTGDISEKEKDKIADNLREYCKMDTFAMYAIWKKLLEVI